MKYGLGIDAGGTYTDAVIVREDDGKVIDSTKSPTTYPDPLPGIQNALDSLNPSYLNNVSKISVSTTLATNAVLENTVSERSSGHDVALIMIGDVIKPTDSKIPYTINVQGGHSSNGMEIHSLDTKNIRDFILETKDKVAAFAVSSHFSIRNPDHELKTKEIIEEMTGLPVVCGHELSQSLGSYERGVTAYIDAQLVPISTKFMNAVVSEIERRGIDAKIMMLKCDGSVVGIVEALKHPIESVFTGPAASLVGASYLSKMKDCIVIDVGGTSTDVAKVTDGIPEITDEGAVVGGWKTKVKAIRMETSAMGGDSHIWIKNGRISVGPRRVIPICMAATKWPAIKEKLKRTSIPSKIQLCENIQPTKFYVRAGHKPDRMSKTEKKLFDRIGDEPTSINEIFTDGLPSSVFLDLLIKKKIVHAIGFTPTDALHVLGDYTEWDCEASRIAAGILSKMTHSDHTTFCEEIKNVFGENMAVYVMSYLLREIDHVHIKKIIENKDQYITKFKVGVPVVLLGGPVQAYVDNIRGAIDAEIILPEYAEVGNAVGAIVGKVTKRVQILIRNVYEGNKSITMMFTPTGRKRFRTYPQALEEADIEGKRLVMEYLNNSGLQIEDHKIEVIKQDIKMNDADIFPMETNLVFVGVGDVEN
ncbi:hydantoinase/oxoprolinase family protein [Methanococcoides alaskense]|uniref:N-methylhydantoinase A/oxoprolinase/acetone carboxylase beta subunit n=1 Tax=Methanococcoides alaskense TaxID=325778 RepID=A0AA90TXC5_9EURY|nr:hydantoinase/oxoprolinase family protein [Methanococcoides alaskense]MDA0525353.1 hydantoinase/oxoprolinase family protein [Methanococcoides alaskense]MDR6221717.1 N-methylhydantoinase A/oxoprolinase/acetone carboxylase beta subunit [Methanococcoides alaskense]